MNELMWSMGKRSVARDTYPDCRKDAQCCCNMCMASINATLDLRPPNSQFSSVTNWSETPSRAFASPPSVAGGKENQWPSSQQSKNRPSTLPRKERRWAPSQALNSTAKSGVKLFDDDATEEPMQEKVIFVDETQKKGAVWRKFVVVFMFVVVEFVVPWCLSGLFKPVFSAEKVMGIAGESMVRNRLADRLDFIARKMARVVPGQVVNCTGSDSTWKVEQDGLMVHSRCILYSSIAEEVALWGYPTQTSGVIGRGIVNRSFTIMSGRMIEWYEGKTEYVVRQQEDSWIHAKWTASVVQLNGQTWILEYKPSAALQGGVLVSHAVGFLKCLISRIYEQMKLSYGSFLLPRLNVRNPYHDFRTPT